MKIAVFSFPSGRTGVLHASPRKMAELIAGGLTEEAAMQFLVDKDVQADATDVAIVDETSLPSTREFRNAWETVSGAIEVNMPKARDIHGERMAVAHANEIAVLKVEERKERLKGNTAKADAHAATGTALEALDLNVLATRIGNANNPTALSAIWPSDVPKHSP